MTRIPFSPLESWSGMTMLPVLAAFICLISCNPITDTGPKIIRINEADFINIPLAQVLPVSDFTPLEFTPESALAESAMFLDYTSGFYLMDKYKKKVVYQFDQSGQFIRTIGKQGKGPGEYNDFTDAMITENGLELLSPGGHTDVFKYGKDGRFLRTDRMLDQYSHSFAVNPQNGNYLFFCPYYQHLIQEVDKISLQRVDSFLVRNIKISLGGANTFSSTSLGLVLCNQSFDNRIFAIAGDSLKVRYQFDVGASTPDYDALTEEGQMKLLKEGVFWYIYKTLENTRWLYLLMSKQDNSDETQSQFYGLLCEKKTGKLYRLPDSPEPGPLFHPAFALDEDDILYTAVQPVNIYESAEWKEEFAKRNIPLTMDGNFVVIKMPIREIVR
jgi:hypothetical protein